jgi:hypothetical protein
MTNLPTKPGLLVALANTIKTRLVLLMVDNRNHRASKR